MNLVSRVQSLESRRGPGGVVMCECPGPNGSGRYGGNAEWFTVYPRGVDPYAGRAYRPPWARKPRLYVGDPLPPPKTCVACGRIRRQCTLEIVYDAVMPPVWASDDVEPAAKTRSESPSKKQNSEVTT